MLGTDGETNGRRRDMLFGQFLWRKLRVGGSIGMDDEALHIGYISQQREDLQCIDELPGFLLTEMEPPPLGKYFL